MSVYCSPKGICKGNTFIYYFVQVTFSTHQKTFKLFQFPKYYYISIFYENIFGN